MSSPPQILAADALKQLDALEAGLALDFVVRPNDKKQLYGLRRVSMTALRMAAGVVAAEPARFPHLDGIADDTAYVEAMTPLLDRATELVTHLRKSIWNRHLPAATKTLALYAMVKGLARLPGNETMRELLPHLRAELAPKHKNPRPKQTAEQRRLKDAARARARRAAKALERLQANSGPLVIAAPAEPPLPP